MVLKEFWEVEELRDELLDVIGVVHEGLPRGRDGVELAVGAVKPGPRQDGTDEHLEIHTGNSRYVLAHTPLNGNFLQ